MKHLATLLLLCGICIFATAQNYPVGHRSINFKDAARTGGYAISGGTTFPTGGTGRDIGTEVYYPATSAGDNTPFATGVFPLVVFGHGFAMTWDSYKSFTDSLVRNGYIVALPRTEGSLTGPSHLDFGKDLAKVVELMQQANTTTGSPFLNRLTNRAAIGGHSMGGGATFLADAFAPAEVKCYFTFAAAETNPSAVAAAANITRPHLTISGSYDCVAPPASHQNLIYNALASTCKTKIELIKGYHCAFADNSFTCGFGEGTCITSGGLTVANQLLLTRRYLNPYLDYYLKGICPAWTKFEDLLDSTTTATIQQSCNNIVPSNAAIMGDTAFCEGDSTILKASPTGFSYLWNSTFTTDSVIRKVSTQITLEVGNAVCTLPAVSVHIQTVALPTMPTISLSNDTICAGDTLLLSAYNTYAYAQQWSIPTPWQVVAGNNTDSMAIVVDTYTDTVSVYAYNQCGVSIAANAVVYVPVNTLNLGMIQGDTTVCEGNAITYSVDSIPGAERYLWTFNGQTNNVSSKNILIQYDNNQATATLQVSASNACVQSNSQLIHINIENPSVGITQSSDTLYATLQAGYIYQWLNGSDTIVGATQAYYVVTTAGNYTVIATSANGCAASDNITATYTSITEQTLKGSSIYPNPIKRGDMLQLPSNKQVKVYNNLGALVYEAEHASQINTAAFAAGIYVIWLDGNATKLVIE